MSKVIIHYFTGTGNTAHSVNLISEQLQAVGYEVKSWQVKKDVLPPDEVSDYHIFAFPVLSWAAPVIMKRYLRKMPDDKGTKTAILAINGAIFNNGKLVKGYTGQALEQVENILKRKKYDVFLTGNASFPDNWTQVTNPCSVQDTEAIFPLGEAEVQVFIENFLPKKRELYRCGLFNRFWSYLTAGLFGAIGRRFLGKFYIADEHCTGCSICAKKCPVSTIKMNHKMPYWGNNCEDCNRCINICPEKAIQVSVPLFILQTSINLGLTIWAIWAILVYIPRWLQINKIFLISTEIALIIIATLLLLWVSFVPIDAFFRLLLRNLRVRRFFSISYTTKFRRYTAPGFNPLK
jgi:Pyruvate/2-oxoacid:ferredoxin oxidoreductase delta subunit/flavodoxin